LFEDFSYPPRASLDFIVKKLSGLLSGTLVFYFNSPASVFNGSTVSVLSSAVWTLLEGLMIYS